MSKGVQLWTRRPEEGWHFSVGLGNDITHADLVFVRWDGAVQSFPNGNWELSFWLPEGQDADEWYLPCHSQLPPLPEEVSP